MATLPTDPPQSLRWSLWLRELTLERIIIATSLALVVALILNPAFKTPFFVLLGRTLFVALVLLGVFVAAGLSRQRWWPRWLKQVVAVALAAPLATLLVYLVSTQGDWRFFLSSDPHLTGYVMTTAASLVLGIVIALGALVRQREAQAQAQALAFQLERESLERQAADARLGLLQAQIEPHFLFNTLANVQALVESGSPRAPAVLQSLIDYLRAAMPRLHDAEPTLGNELALVRAYLSLMQMRMPDRLDVRMQVDDALAGRRFPAMALLTLVENAVHHGIDPSETGGTIEIGAQPEPDGGLRLWVGDTGVGMAPDAQPGTGLNNLRARLKAFFGAGAELRLSDQSPRGLRAEILIPAGSR